MEENKNKSAMVPAALTLGIISIVFAIFGTYLYQVEF